MIVPSSAPHEDAVGAQVDQRRLAAEILLQPQGFQDVGALAGQPLGQAELLGGPLLRLPAVDADRAEGLPGRLHGGAEHGLERLPARNLQDRQVGAQRGVVEAGGAILLDDQLRERMFRRQRLGYGAASPSPALARIISRSACFSQTITAAAASPNMPMAAAQTRCITACSLPASRADSSSVAAGLRGGPARR